MAGKKPETAVQTSAPANTIKLVVDKECKGSVRYALPPGTPDDVAFRAAVTNVYVNRGAFPQGMPAAVEVTVRGA